MSRQYKVNFSVYNLKIEKLIIDIGHDILTSEAALEDGESFAQFKIIIKIILASEQYWVPHSTMIFDETIRLSREWLSSQETSELLWVDQHESVGLHILPQPKTVPERPAGIQYYDLQVTGG